MGSVLVLPNDDIIVSLYLAIVLASIQNNLFCLSSYSSPLPPPALCFLLFAFLHRVLAAFSLVSIPFLFSYFHLLLFLNDFDFGSPSFITFLLFSLSACSLDYEVRAPAVDYQSVDSRRAAKASSTNMKLCPNETLWLWTAENKPPYQFWTSLGSQSCL